MGARGGDEKAMWPVPRGCSEKRGFFFLQPVLLQDTLPPLCPSPRVLDVPAGRSPSPSSLPEGSLPTASPPLLSQKNTIAISNRTEEERLGPDLSERFSSPELLALTACRNSYFRLVQNTSFFVFL